MTDSSSPSRSGRLRLLWLGGAAVLILALVVWFVVAGGSDDDDPADTASPAFGSPTGQATEAPSVSLGADGEPMPTKEPGQTEPTEVVEPGKLPKPERVALDDTVDVGDGVDVQVAKIEAVQGKGQGTGETSGPSLRFTVVVDNGSGEDLDMIASVLTAYYGAANTPASDLSAPGVRPFPDTIAAGKSASATYVFNIPTDERNDLRLDFSFSTDVPKVIFTGSA